MFRLLACVIVALTVTAPAVHPVALLLVASCYLWRASGDAELALLATGAERRALLDSVVTCLVIAFTCAVRL